jgi:hypothetical protein
MAALSVFAVGCWGDNPQIGAGEAFRVKNTLGQGQFIAGSGLPGAPLQDAGPNPAPPTESEGPSTTPPQTSTGAPYPGQADARFFGNATPDTAAIGLFLDGVSTGYWVVPIQDPDLNTGRLNWNVSADFGREIPAGKRLLRAVAMDKNGRAGPQAATPICIKGLVNDNLQSCSAARHPPEAVITLNWDVSSDVDLQVVAPDGFVYEPKRSSTRKVDGGMALPPAATFDRDSNAACRGDGFRVENLAWTPDGPGPLGRYRIYANLFDACKQPAVHFAITVYQAEGGEDGGVKHLEQKFTATGVLLDTQANGGAQPGLFVTEFVFR